ncbi:MAG: DUF192 domain-containing protein [Rhizobiaceae bacterium]|nr:DUF192 domain-containing protein [Rhizobiaceae bacterium]
MPFLVALARKLFLVVCIIAGSGVSVLAEQPMILPIDQTPLVIDTGQDEAQFNIEVADDAIERSRGLMFRHEMPADRGMLFVFEQQQPLAFWMKNTILPLDLVFIDERGTVQAVLPGVPFSEAPISPGKPSRYVLELKQGTAKRLGIDAGDKVRHPLIGKNAN